jgi:hypothetical protein
MKTFTFFLFGETIMLWTIIAVLLVLWVLGLATHIAGSLIHLLLVLAVVLVLVRLITGRRPVV